MRLALLLIIASLVSACTAPGGKTGMTFDRISDELQAAKASGHQGGDTEAVNRALLPPLQVDVPAAASSRVEPRFDLVVNNAPAGQVFMALVSGTRYSMLAGPEISGTLTLNLKDVTVREALDTIRELYGYEYRIQGTRIFIQPNTMQTRVFQINYLAGRRQGSSDVRVSGSSISGTQPVPGSAGVPVMPGATTVPGTPGAPGTPAGGQTRGVDSSRVYTTSDSDFWKELTTALGAIVGKDDGRNVIVNPVSGVILVRAMPGEMRNVENYLRATQVIIERQVMLEAKIIEVNLNDEYQAGVNWSVFKSGNNSRLSGGVVGKNSLIQSNGGLSVGDVAVIPGRGGSVLNGNNGQFLGLAFQTGSFAALLNFLETQGNVQVLSSPRIATLNNQKAVLKVGTDEFFVTNVSTTTTTTVSGNQTTPTITVQPFFSGISLDVTPQIDEERNIILHVHPSISVVSEKQKVIDLGATLGQFTLPLASSNINETDSIVRVQDGNIVAIGGLMKQQQTQDRTQLPGLGDLPVVGGLFGQRSSATRKQELVILIKPTVIQGSQSWQQDLEDTQARIGAYDPRLNQRRD
ncbi:MAG: pilus (MSHA type) biogenesis protein MshL [Betaproteobacteria bacterium]|nr:pilus (MSHA type) biogenesis protein MshL [Betaproteobacteria bacterium]